MEAHRKSKQQEKRITRNLREIGLEARKQMASGAIWFAKSDVVSSLFQVEAKTKVKVSKSMSLKKEWLDKIADEALQGGKIPLLAVSFGDGRDYFVINDRDFLALIEELVQYREGDVDA